jgi:hypothetical protein
MNYFIDIIIMNDKLPALKKVKLKINKSYKIAAGKGLKHEVVADIKQIQENEELKNYMLRVSIAQSYMKTLTFNTNKLGQMLKELHNAFADKEKGIIYLL